MCKRCIHQIFFSLVKVESSLSPTNLVLLTTNLFNFLIAERFRDCKGILAMIFIDSSFWGGAMANQTEYGLFFWVLRLM